MAVTRNLSNDSHHTYLPTIALFCGIICTIAMLKFGGFKASFDLMSGKKKCKERYNKTSDIPVLGAYRSNREEYFGNNANTDNTNRKLTVSMVALPQTNQSKPGIKTSKSTSDLLKSNEAPRNSMKNTGNIPSSPSNKKHSKNIKLKDQKKEKVNEQLKLKKDNRDSKNADTHLVKPKSEKKKPAPQPPVIDSSQTHVPYSSNTLESSISRSSGPPPYSAEAFPSECDSSGNTSFGKPLHEKSSWDLVSQHRQQLNRPLIATNSKPKSTVLDLRYNADSARQPLHVKDNSEA